MCAWSFQTDSCRLCASTVSHGVSASGEPTIHSLAHSLKVRAPDYGTRDPQPCFLPSDYAPEISHVLFAFSRLVN